MTLDDLERQNKGFYGFFDCDTFQERIALKSLETGWDSLRIKLSGLNVTFTRLNFGFRCFQGILSTGASNLGTP